MGFLSILTSLLLLTVWTGWWWLHLDRGVIGTLCALVAVGCWVTGRWVTTRLEQRRGNRLPG
jgi:hypothetical protein